MTESTSRRTPWWGCLILAVSLGMIAHPAVAQSFYPSGIIRILIGSGAGTPPDIVTRIVANELAQSEGWRIVVENKPGATATLAAAEVLRQPADGYSVLAFTLGASAAPALLSNIPFRHDTDFAPVIKVMTAHHVLVVGPTVPATSVTELIALLKREPDKLTFSSGGMGTPAHLVGEQFRLQTGVRVTHVPYRALPQAIGDLLNGTNHYQFVTPLPVLDLIAAGKLRALAVTGPRRMAALKEVPTVVEAGFPQLVIEDWFGFVVKKGTPEVIIDRLNAAINKALGQASVREAFAKIAAEPAGGTPGELGAHIQSQIAHWSKVVKDAGIKIGE
jgi:tripartite-type tricarboxylate transporter receptor subunit TctC